jgi:trimeric autotransporter adhesin
MKKKIYFLATALMLFTAQSDAQSVAITENGDPPDARAILDVQAHNKGVLFPRMSSASRLALPNIKGMLIYDTVTNSFWYNTGNGWQAPGPDSISQAAWQFIGNSGMSDINFLGTTDSRPLFLRINNEPAGHIAPNSQNTAWGLRAGNLNSGSLNTANGAYALSGNTLGYENTAMGLGSLLSNTEGYNNTACGYNSLNLLTKGYSNTALGYDALFFKLGDNYSSSVGFQALRSNYFGSYSTAAGVYSLYRNGRPVNSALGAYTFYENTSGQNNTVVGFSAAPNAGPYGDNNTTIGTYSYEGGSNATIIGFLAAGPDSNAVRLGNSAVTIIEGAVPFTTTSDGRFKYNVQEVVHGLDFILRLRPVTYQFDAKNFDEQQRGAQNDSMAAVLKDIMRDAYDEAISARRSGFIAQEVQDAATATGYNFSGVNTPKTEQDHYSLSYASFVVPLVKAVKEQQQIIADLQKQLAELKPLVQQRAGNKQPSHLKQP